MLHTRNPNILIQNQMCKASMSISSAGVSLSAPPKQHQFFPNFLATIF